MRNEADPSGLGLGRCWEVSPAKLPFFTGPLFPATLPMKGRNGGCSVGCRKPPPHAALELIPSRAALGL